GLRRSPRVPARHDTRAFTPPAAAAHEPRHAADARLCRLPVALTLSIFPAALDRRSADAREQQRDDSRVAHRELAVCVPRWHPGHWLRDLDLVVRAAHGLPRLGPRLLASF